jgi:heme-degrading monooxygenase HmoA
MFARLVEAPAKPGKKSEIVAILANELEPALKKQSGFVDFIGLASDTSPEEGITLTFWATKNDAERFYGTQEFKSKILDRITPLVENMTIRTFNVEVSTFHKVAAVKAA